MEVRNKDHIRRRGRVFALSFIILLAMIFISGAFTLITAQKGVALLEEKKMAYESVIQKQAEFNFQLEQIFKDLHNLRVKKRTTNEYKHMQKLITGQRMMMEEELSGFSPQEASNYIVYKSILEVVKETQVALDAFDAESRKREYNMDQLEKCRQKYQEITRRDNGKDK